MKKKNHLGIPYRAIQVTSFARRLAHGVALVLSLKSEEEEEEEEWELAMVQKLVHCRPLWAKTSFCSDVPRQKRSGGDVETLPTSFPNYPLTSPLNALLFLTLLVSSSVLSSYLLPSLALYLCFIIPLLLLPLHYPLTLALRLKIILL